MRKKKKKKKKKRLNASWSRILQPENSIQDHIWRNVIKWCGVTVLQLQSSLGFM
jgi:hypothetical protein